ncbi:MFS monosaccharide transporter [Trametopsis cervina]|nr:MFS monosaccharide transporter [Trametopsis cervina]
MVAQSAGYVALSTEPAEHSAPSSPVLGTHALSNTHATPHGGTFTYHSNSHSYVYSYGPSGLAGLLHNYYALACALFASIGGLLFGYDQGVIANVLVMKDFMARWPIGAWEKGLMTAMLELGCLLGALITGTFADHLTRRQSIIFACIVFCIGSTFQFAAQTFPHLIIGRAIGGLGIGALSMLSPIYMAEISPPEVRGSLMALEQFSIVLGAVLGFWTGFFTRDVSGSASWRIPLGVQLVPGILLALGSLVLPASPRLLVAHGRHSEALRSLAKLRRRLPDEVDGDPLLQIELLEMRTEVLLVERTTGSSVKDSGLRAELKAWGMLFTKKYLNRTMIGVLMMFFQQWSGINALLYYGPTLMRELGLQGDTVTLMVSGGIGITQFISVFPVIIYIDRLGRKPLLRYGSAVMCLAHLLIAVLVWEYGADWPSHSAAAWTAVVCTYIFTAAYGVSYGPIGWILPSEVFPISMRSRGVALSTASNWFNNFLIGLATPVLMELSPSGTFMVFSTACFLGYFWSTYIVPETGNVSLEEMDEVFGSSAGVEDTRLKKEIETDLGLHILISGLTASSDSDNRI